jgi:hypothetical protein
MSEVEDPNSPEADDCVVVQTSLLCDLTHSRDKA